MKRELLELLADPISRAPLRLSNAEMVGDEIVSGVLDDGAGHTYPITNGIPRLAATNDENQLQTSQSFGYKWGRRETYESASFNEFRIHWFLQRCGFRDEAEMLSYFSQPQSILDAGCGSGTSSSLWLRPENRTRWYGLEISGCIDVAKERLTNIPNAHFVQGDMMKPPFRERSFEMIYALGTLHHTPSTEAALQSLIQFLKPGGQFLFYVYRKKSPIREFTDDYVREIVSGLPPPEAWERLKPLTKLGETLAKLKAEIAVEEDIPDLGIRAGKYDVQRFIYWHFAKLFWNENLSFDENHHVNFDWYHPRYAHRHTEEEIRRWCAEAGLAIQHFRAEESGFTVRGILERE
ncbi:MAG: methyltransferase domain-containing protein [Candidatus Omnitrophota bacterium]